MQETMNITARINNGRISTESQQIIRRYIKAHDGKVVNIGFKIDNPNRTNLQNSYYWAGIIPVIRAAFNDLGHQLTASEVHTFLVDKFNSVEMLTDDGVLIGRKPLKTSTMSKKDFAEYVDRIAQFAAEILNVEIPPPMTQVQMNYEN